MDTNDKAQTAFCIFCDREVLLNELNEDAATGRSICTQCVNTEYELSQAE